MLIGSSFDLYREGDNLIVVDKVLGEKFKLGLDEFEDYLEDVVEFIGIKA